ncbi:extracellular solute-binding protein [Mariluticola halotolerans]|uniref:extracellular solute-binding protein n=1 Tax=Mariluticola halotolerans TaxID=2909283 RepID=UPI0026E29738|nr:extracellular solute-binding protein [Mariluticola halotolerans]UJQ94743.1 extracellular solute-binding protein [Mariluticola halotolerans]
MIRRLSQTIAATALGALIFGSSASAVEIEYWQYYFAERVDAIDQLIEKFEAENPDITVKHTHFPYAQYRTKVAAAVPAGEGPDVMQFYYGWLPDYLKAGLVQPLSTTTFSPSAIEETFFPIVERMKVNDAYMGLPTAVRSLAMFYNKDLFKKAGLDPETPPATYADLVKAATAIAEHDDAGNLLVAGITATPVSQDAHWWREVLIRQFGGQPYSDDGTQVAYNTPEGAEALHAYTDMFMTHKATDYGFMNESQASFAAQRAGILIDGSFRIGAVQKMEGLDWGVAPLPSHDGITSNYASYWVNGISAAVEGEKLEAAEKFLAFLTTDESMQLWLDVVGELPAKPAVALTESNANDPIYGPFIAGLETAQTTSFVNESEQRKIWLDMIDRINIGGVSVEDSLAAAAEEEQKLLDSFYAE